MSHWQKPGIEDQNYLSRSCANHQMPFPIKCFMKLANPSFNYLPLKNSSYFRSCSLKQCYRFSHYLFINNPSVRWCRPHQGRGSIPRCSSTLRNRTGSNPHPETRENHPGTFKRQSSPTARTESLYKQKKSLGRGEGTALLWEHTLSYSKLGRQ